MKKQIIGTKSHGIEFYSSMPLFEALGSIIKNIETLAEVSSKHWVIGRVNINLRTVATATMQSYYDFPSLNKFEY